MSTEPTVLDASDIGRLDSARNQWLLSHVGLAVGRGDRVAIVGQSGSGKTLLLRSLAYLDPLDSGEIRWHGQAVNGHAIPAFRSRVMYLHQQPALMEGTVEENLRLPLTLQIHKGAEFDRERVLGLLNRLGRDASFLEKQQRDLSGGEAQITALVRAVQLSPEVLLLDEPTAALDDRTVRAVEELLDNWMIEQPGNPSTVWVTHDREQARRVARRVYQMEAGRITADT